MDRDALRTAARDGRIQPVEERCEMTGAAATWRRKGHAWFVRAVAVTLLAGGAVAAYLLFSAV